MHFFAVTEVTVASKENYADQLDRDLHVAGEATAVNTEQCGWQALSLLAGYRVCAFQEYSHELPLVIVQCEKFLFCQKNCKHEELMCIALTMLPHAMQYQSPSYMHKLHITLKVKKSCK